MTPRDRCLFDMWQATREEHAAVALDEYTAGLVRDAVAAERERCAKVAEEYISRVELAEYVAAKIREAGR